MLSNTEILDIIHNDESFYQAVLNITKKHELSDDLYTELLLIISDYDNEALNSLQAKNQLKFFWVRICMNQWNSSTSPFYTKYRKDNHEKLYYDLDNSQLETRDEYQYNLEEEEPFSSVVNRVSKRVLNELYWYNKRLFNLYLELGSYREVSENTNIPARSVGKTIREVKRELKKEINNELERMNR